MIKKITFLFFTLLTSGIIAQATATLDGVVYTSIAEAYTAAAGGDVINIDGFFDEILISNKAVSFKGDDPATDGFDLTTAGRALKYTESVSGDFSISNLSFKNGTATGNGGAIWFDKPSSSLIKLDNLIFDNNVSTNNGGAISIVSANVTMNKIILKNNEAKNGGGIHMGVVNGAGSTAGANKIINISNSLIHNNSTSLIGAGFYVYAGGTAVNKTLTINIDNTTIALNQATTTGGIGYAVGGRLAGGSTLPNLNINMTHVTCARNTATGNAANFGLYFHRTHGAAANNVNFNAYNSIFVGAGTVTKRGINFGFAQVPNFINNVSSNLNNIGNITNNINNTIGRTTEQIGVPAALSDEGGFSKVLALTSDTADAFNHCTSPTGTSLIAADQRIDRPRDVLPDAGAFERNVTRFATTWTGNTNTDWNTVTNWSNGIPTTTLTVIVPNLTNDPSATGAVDLFDMVIESDASVSVAGAVNIASTITLNSGASLIAKAGGNVPITYNRNLATSNWYLISSPVLGQDVDDFVTASLLQQNLPNLGLGTVYSALNDTWTYYQNGTNNSDVFIAGQGYAVNLKDASRNISFTGGIMNVSDQSNALVTAGNGFNLLGNPYPSYVNSGSMLAASTGAILTETIWVWDQSLNSGAGGYATKVTVDNFQLAPTQGFFVQSNGAAGSVAINEAFQTHQGTDTFLKMNPRPEVHVTLNDGTNEMLTKLYYIDGASKGFDNGFDGPMFGGVSNSLAVYTHSLENGLGRNLAIQSLPNNDFENLIVPIGVKALSGKEITFSANTLNFPDGINVYLEDKNDSSFTLLNDSSNFMTTLSSDLNGIGRFYLHTKSSVLNTNEVTLENISIYKTDNTTLRIVGLSQGKTAVKLFNILGKQVLNSSFISNGVKDISLPRLAKGVYIVQLETAEGKLNKKIILE